jgi:hypothetical protein
VVFRAIYFVLRYRQLTEDGGIGFNINNTVTLSTQKTSKLKKYISKTIMKKPNKLKIKTINATWCDKDTVMLHACFQLLTDFIEDEKPFENKIEWSISKEKQGAKKEIEFLNSWWKNLLEKANGNLLTIL